MSSNAKSLARAGASAFEKMEKVNGELLAMTYGAFVVHLLSQGDSVDRVNTTLEKMGYNIGVRLVDEFLAKSGVRACTTFRETADVIANVALRMFLGVEPAEVQYHAPGEREKEKDAKPRFRLTIKKNPLADFVEIPGKYRGTLLYFNLFAGVIRGALEMVQMRVECDMVRPSDKGERGLSEMSQPLVMDVILLEIIHEIHVDD